MEQKKERVTLVDKSSGATAPVRSEVPKYLKKMPHLEERPTQQKVKKAKRNDPDARVDVWDTVKKKRKSGASAPMQKNLDKFLKKYPDHEVYVDQNEKSLVDKVTGAPVIVFEKRSGAPLDLKRSQVPGFLKTYPRFEEDDTFLARNRQDKKAANETGILAEKYYREVGKVDGNGDPFTPSHPLNRKFSSENVEQNPTKGEVHCPTNDSGNMYHAESERIIDGGVSYISTPEGPPILMVNLNHPNFRTGLENQNDDKFRSAKKEYGRVAAKDSDEIDERGKYESFAQCWSVKSMFISENDKLDDSKEEAYGPKKNGKEIGQQKDIEVEDDWETDLEGKNAVEGDLLSRFKAQEFEIPGIGHFAADEFVGMTELENRYEHDDASDSILTPEWPRKRKVDFDDFKDFEALL